MPVSDAEMLDLLLLVGGETLPEQATDIQVAHGRVGFILYSTQEQHTGVINTNFSILNGRRAFISQISRRLADR